MEINGRTNIMIDFQIRNDVKLLFRNDPVNDLANITKGKRVLFVYGGGSVSTNGCKDDIKNAVSNGKGQLFELPNTSYELADIEKGIEFSKEKQIEIIIGAGGAKVMDAAKLISFGYYHSDLWDYVKEKKSPLGLKRLPLILIPTYPSSGSEFATGACAVDSRTKDYGVALGITSDYSFLVPKYTTFLGPELTAYSIFVTFVQLSTSVLGDRNPISYDFGISVIKNLIKAANKLKTNPQDLEARGVVLYAASISTSDWLGIGREKNYSFYLYEIEYLPEILFGASYRKSLTVLFPRFLNKIAKYYEDDVRLYFHDVFNESGTIDELTNRLIQVFTDFGIDMYFHGDFSEEKFNEIPIPFIDCYENSVTSLKKEDVFGIIKDSMK